MMNEDASIKVHIDTEERLSSETVLVHRSAEEEDAFFEGACGEDFPSLKSSDSLVKGAVGGIVVKNSNSQNPSNMTDSKTDQKKTDSQTRTSPTNPMSVSVPNLPSSTEHTASLLESFSSVLRRNRGNNNMTRCSNMSSLARLALQANSPSTSKSNFLLYILVWKLTQQRNESTIDDFAEDDVASKTDDVIPKS
jgi:hypothetical protein